MGITKKAEKRIKKETIIAAKTEKILKYFHFPSPSSIKLIRESSFH
jgi:hypothetical protein